MHLADVAHGVMGTSAVVGTIIPNAVGYAYATKFQRKDHIVVSFFGDGAVEEGVFHESLNFAALKKLPFIFVYKNNWLALGIEAANQDVRREISKGSFEALNVREMVEEVEDSGIEVIANYIFGFPNDTLETMQETLDSALQLSTAMANMYPCQALLGSVLYHTCVEKGWPLPDSYEGYAFLSYERQPMPTEFLSTADVLKFRDQA